MDVVQLSQGYIVSPGIPGTHLINHRGMKN